MIHSCNAQNCHHLSSGTIVQHRLPALCIGVFLYEAGILICHWHFVMDIFILDVNFFLSLPINFLKVYRHAFASLYLPPWKRKKGTVILLALCNLLSLTHLCATWEKSLWKVTVNANYFIHCQFISYGTYFYITCSELALVVIRVTKYFLRIWR